MTRISLGACILTLVVSSQGWGTTFEPLGLRNFCRHSAVGFGQGYHSKPVPPNLRPHYSRVQQPGPWNVVPPPVYPCSPYAPTATSDAMRRFGTVTPANRYYGGPMMMPESWSPPGQPYQVPPRTQAPPAGTPARGYTRFPAGQGAPGSVVDRSPTANRDASQYRTGPPMPGNTAPFQASPPLARDSRFQPDASTAQPAQPSDSWSPPDALQLDTPSPVPNAPNSEWEEYGDHEPSETADTMDGASADDPWGEVPPPPPMVVESLTPQPPMNSTPPTRLAVPMPPAMDKSAAAAPVFDAMDVSQKDRPFAGSDGDGPPREWSREPDGGWALQEPSQPDPSLAPSADDEPWDQGVEDLQPIPLAELPGPATSRDESAEIEPQGFFPPKQSRTPAGDAVTDPTQAASHPSWSDSSSGGLSVPPTRILPYGQPRVWW